MSLKYVAFSTVLYVTHMRLKELMWSGYMSVYSDIANLKVLLMMKVLKRLFFFQVFFPSATG